MYLKIFYIDICIVALVFNYKTRYKLNTSPAKCSAYNFITLQKCICVCLHFQRGKWRLVARKTRTQVYLIICHVPVCLSLLCDCISAHQKSGPFQVTVMQHTEFFHSSNHSISISASLSVLGTDLKVILTYAFISTHNLVNTQHDRLSTLFPFFCLLYPLYL